METIATSDGSKTVCICDDGKTGVVSKFSKLR